MSARGDKEVGRIKLIEKNMAPDVFAPGAKLILQLGLKMLYFLYWPYRLIVRTSAFQAGNLGAIPSRVTQRDIREIRNRERIFGTKIRTR